MHNMKFLLTLDLSHPAPQTSLLGSDPREFRIFFQIPHMYVQNDQCNDGVILRYTCWSTRGPAGFNRTWVRLTYRLYATWLYAPR